MKKPKLVDKKLKKLIDKKCYFCSVDDYNLLDVHRIVPGEEGGRYTDYNTITVCCSCHRKIHSNQIKILGRHYSTAGKYILYFLDEQGKEMWL